MIDNIDTHWRTGPLSGSRTHVCHRSRHAFCFHQLNSREGKGRGMNRPVYHRSQRLEGVGSCHLMLFNGLTM